MSTKALTRTGASLPTVFEDFFKPWNEWFDTGSTLWNRILTVPAVNIIESKDDFKISIAVPGMKKEDFDIAVNGNMMTISSEKQETKEDRDSKYTRKEYNYSSFSRSFTLPEDVRKDNIEATYNEGVLSLVLPKKEEAKLHAAKHISVK